MNTSTAEYPLGLVPRTSRPLLTGGCRSQSCPAISECLVCLPLEASLELSVAEFRFSMSLTLGLFCLAFAESFRGFEGGRGWMVNEGLGLMLSSM